MPERYCIQLVAQRRWWEGNCKLQMVHYTFDPELVDKQRSTDFQCLADNWERLGDCNCFRSCWQVELGSYLMLVHSSKFGAAFEEHNLLLVGCKQGDYTLVELLLGESNWEQQMEEQLHN